MKKVWLYILLCVLFFSCNHSEQSDVDVLAIELSSPILLEGQVLNVSNKIFNPRDIFLIDNEIVIYDYVDSGFIKVVDPLTAEVKSWGVIGDGSSGYFYHIDMNSIHYDGGNINFVEYPFLRSFIRDSSSRDQMFVETNTCDLNYFPGMISGVLNLGEGTVLLNCSSSDMDTRHEYAFLDCDSSVVSDPFGTHPELDMVFDDPANRMQFLLKHLLSNSSDDKFASVYRHLNSVQVYDFSGNLLSSLSFEGLPSPEWSLENSRLFFPHARSTKSSIWTLYIGKTFSEIEEAGENIQPEIFVIDWNGNGCISRFRS